MAEALEHERRKLGILQSFQMLFDGHFAVAIRAGYLMNGDEREYRGGSETAYLGRKELPITAFYAFARAPR